MNCTKQADKAGSRVFTLIWLTTAASTVGRLLSLALREQSQILWSYSYNESTEGLHKK
jgi:hypothetical protein